MPSVGSRPLFLFSCSLSSGLDGGGGVGGGGVEMEGVSVCVRASVCFCRWRVERVEHPPGVCFGLVMRSWMGGGGCVLDCARARKTKCNLLICSENMLDDQYQSCITRGHDICSYVCAVVRHSLPSVRKTGNKCWMLRALKKRVCRRAEGLPVCEIGTHRNFSLLCNQVLSAHRGEKSFIQASPQSRVLVKCVNTFSGGSLRLG